MLCKDPDGSGLEDTISFCRQKNDSRGKTTYGGRAKSNINILELKQKVVSLEKMISAWTRGHNKQDERRIFQTKRKVENYNSMISW